MTTAPLIHNVENAISWRLSLPVPSWLLLSSQAQPPKSLADVRDGIAQSVVAAVPSALLQANAAHRQIEFIVRH